MAKDKEQKKKGSGGKAAGAAALLLLLAGGGYFGLGGGRGLLPGGESAGNGDTLLPNNTPAVVQTAENPAPAEEDAQPGEESLSIRVSESAITLNGEAVELDDLEQALWDGYSDGMSVTLTDDHAIKATYDAVTALLGRLDIPYSVE